MQIILVTIGTILAILFLIQLKRGKKYESMIVNLDNNVFPLPELYVVGFVWSELKIFAISENMLLKLRRQAAVLYPPQFSEFYANIVWAQTLSLVHLLLAVSVLFAGATNAFTFLLIGAFFTVLVYVYCQENMKNTIESRREKCEDELPNVASTMAILVNSGMMLRETWKMIAHNNKGAFYQLMRQAIENMNNGYSDAQAILLLGKESNSKDIKKFTSALVQSVEKGGGELDIFLTKQSSELWNEKRQKALQSGEKAATKLLLPIVLIFIGIIIIVITAAFAGSLF
ncbi:MAG: type II secretion system F family protein [Suipraeoptans sp.]